MSSALYRTTLLRDAAAVKRFHVKRTLRTQTVGEHTFGVMLLLRSVLPDNISAEGTCNLMFAAMHHDLPELVTGDIPAPAKWEHPELGALLDRIERSAQGLYLDVDLSDQDATMLKWADITELLLWCLEERSLGNITLDDTIQRALHHVSGLGLLWPAAAELTKQIQSSCEDFGLVPLYIKGNT